MTAPTDPQNKQVPQNTTPAQRKRTWRMRFLIFSLKFGFTVFCCALFYLAYLDTKIRHTLDGSIWQLPAEVYAQIETIEQPQHPTLTEVRERLIDNGYRQVNMLGTPGDFKIENNTIVLIRRAFEFPDAPEPQRVLRLRFEDGYLNAIEDLVNRQAISQFRLAPKLIAMMQSNKEDRLAIPLHQYPRYLIDTLLLTEDRRFYEHNGVSLLGITRALITNIQAGQTVQGGSTLTQQLVKNLFLSNRRSLSRKINEALMAILLDARYDKNRILETYLNEVYLAQYGDTEIHGFALASQIFFDRPIQEIRLDQIALLVGMVKGPSIYNPWRYPDNATMRRNVILKIMQENGIINENLYQLLSRRPLDVKPKGSVTRTQPAFMQLVKQDLNNFLGDAKASELAGARIFTTLDTNKQRMAEKALVEATQKLQLQKKRPDLEAAMVVADYRTGGVLAMVGGVQTQYAGFNRALRSQRQIGSLVKPSIYLSALANPDQFRLNTPIQNNSIAIQIKGGGSWRPRNYNRSYSGSVMLMDALVRSLNIPTVNIGMKIGLDTIIANQKVMGWDKIKIPHVPAILLGSYSIAPYDVAKLFQVIANAGEKIPLSSINKISRRNGEVIYNRTNTASQVVPREAAIQTLFAMQQAVERGTGRRLQADFADFHLAGKTGTTNNARDTWFVGIDGQDVVTVWLGRDNNGKTGLTGSTGALKLYQHYLSLVPPTQLYLPTSPHIKWIGINDFGGWDCASGRTIPVWVNQNQNFCTQPTPLINSSSQPAPQVQPEHKPSVWDALQLQGHGAPVEEAQPSQ